MSGFFLSSRGDGHQCDRMGYIIVILMKTREVQKRSETSLTVSSEGEREGEWRPAGKQKSRRTQHPALEHKDRRGGGARWRNHLFHAMICLMKRPLLTRLGRPKRDRKKERDNEKRTQKSATHHRGFFFFSPFSLTLCSLTLCLHRL